MFFGGEPWRLVHAQKPASHSGAILLLNYLLDTLVLIYFLCVMIIHVFRGEPWCFGHARKPASHSGPIHFQASVSITTVVRCLANTVSPLSIQTKAFFGTVLRRDAE